MFRELREFAMRGNVVDLAVGIIIGAAFGKIITSLVNDMIMPPIGLLLGRVDFSNLFINLSGQPFASLAEAKAAGAPTINYGVFLNVVRTSLFGLCYFFASEVHRSLADSQSVARRADYPLMPLLLLSDSLESYALPAMHVQSTSRVKACLRRLVYHWPASLGGERGIASCYHRSL